MREPTYPQTLVIAGVTGFLPGISTTAVITGWIQRAGRGPLMPNGSVPVPRAGIYDIRLLSVLINTQADVRHTAEIRIDGTAAARATDYVNTTGGEVHVAPSILVPLTQGQRIDFTAFHNDGSPARAVDANMMIALYEPLGPH